MHPDLYDSMFNCYIPSLVMTNTWDITCKTNIRIYMHPNIYGSMCNSYVPLRMMTYNRDITCTTHICIEMHPNLFGSMCNHYIPLWVMTHNQYITGPETNNHRIFATRIVSPIYKGSEYITKYSNHNIYSHSCWLVLWNPRLLNLYTYDQTKFLSTLCILRLSKIC